jgi:hypothetical protein
LVGPHLDDDPLAVRADRRLDPRLEPRARRLDGGDRRRAVRPARAPRRSRGGRPRRTARGLRRAARASRTRSLSTVPVSVTGSVGAAGSFV